jgi:hypothetical protein
LLCFRRSLPGIGDNPADNRRSCDDVRLDLVTIDNQPISRRIDSPDDGQKPGW